MDNHTIHILSEETVNRIAAGEVIERPASAVKELVENALDAGAKKIVILLEGGGKDLVKVTDDGCGIPDSEVSRAWQRHTTSKIRTAGDLSNVTTMGFRGEALSSMAAVAELKIETRHRSAETGRELTVSNGEEIQNSEISRNPGTSVTVRNLFQHTPARKKFMGTSRSEVNRILQTVTRLSLANPSVSFKILDGKRELLCMVQGPPEDRIGEVFGRNIRNEMIKLNWLKDQIRITGYIGAPEHCMGRASRQYFYVNGRCIFSSLLTRAFSMGYDALPPGKYPIGVLFITLPGEEVDVNVHPAKREVRFLKDDQMFTAVRNAVREGLRTALSGPMFKYEHNSQDLIEPSMPAPRFIYPGSEEHTDSSRNEEPEQTGLFVQSQDSGDYENVVKWPDGSSQQYPAAEKYKQVPEFENNISPVPYLQLHNSYILFEVRSGLMVVNQQAAHERILYEQALEVLKSSGKLGSQQLLFTEVLELGKEETHIINQNLQYFHSLGFDMEPFGGCTFQLRGIPTEVPQNRARQVIFEMVHNLLETRMDKADLFTMVARAYSQGACIKTGKKLDNTVMGNLIDRLFATKNPYTSPSGKPVLIRYRNDEFNRRFGISRD
jgi:DNA mismatch repair protein MutL